MSPDKLPVELLHNVCLNIMGLADDSVDWLPSEEYFQRNVENLNIRNVNNKFSEASDYILSSLGLINVRYTGPPEFTSTTRVPRFGDRAQSRELDSHAIAEIIIEIPRRKAGRQNYCTENILIESAVLRAYFGALLNVQETLTNLPIAVIIAEIDTKRADEKARSAIRDSCQLLRSNPQNRIRFLKNVSNIQQQLGSSTPLLELKAQVAEKNLEFLKLIWELDEADTLGKMGGELHPHNVAKWTHSLCEELKRTESAVEHTDSDLKKRLSILDCLAKLFNMNDYYHTYRPQALFCTKCPLEACVCDTLALQDIDLRGSRIKLDDIGLPPELVLTAMHKFLTVTYMFDARFPSVRLPWLVNELMFIEGEMIRVSAPASAVADIKQDIHALTKAHNLQEVVATDGVEEMILEDDNESSQGQALFHQLSVSKTLRATGLQIPGASRLSLADFK